MAEDARVNPDQESIAEREARRFREKFQAKARISIVGFSGAGKSSLFNRILGRTVSEEPAGGMKGTTASRPEETQGFIIVDCPGYGAGSVTAPDVVLKQTMDPHLVLQVLNGGEAVHDADVALYRVLSRHVKTIVVLNKIDILDATELTEAEDSVLSKLAVPTDMFIPVSARTGARVEKLVRLIVSLLPSGAKEGFLSKLEGHLTVKSEETERIVNYYAGSAAVVGLSPIPFSDLVALFPLQVAMTLHVALIYGHGDLPAKDAAGLVAGSLGTSFVFRYAARQAVKFVPFLGSAVGAVTAFASIQAYGRTISWWFASGMKAPRESLSEYFKKEYARAEVEAKKMDFSKLKREREGK
ncbi:MAG: GTP-binding protein [Candidatus Riflebacteria bacterium]|nr:GTP-binding protein [Candidatus Riflebacteria bacterium]